MPPITLQSPDKKLVTMALMVALGVILHRVEALLPLPTPWIKLGLANIMTLLALVFLGFKEALVVTFCVYFVFIPQDAFLRLLPVFLSLALISGLLTGIVANILTDRLIGENVSFR